MELPGHDRRDSYKLSIRRLLAVEESHVANLQRAVQPRHGLPFEFELRSQRFTFGWLHQRRIQARHAERIPLRPVAAELH